MVRTIRAKFSRGVFEPLEPADAGMVREGQEVLNPIRDTASGWKDLIDADALKRNMYADRVVSTRPDVRL